MRDTTDQNSQHDGSVTAYVDICKPCAEDWQGIRKKLEHKIKGLGKLLAFP
jgi:hypothetical protein